METPSWWSASSRSTGSESHPSSASSSRERSSTTTTTSNPASASWFSRRATMAEQQQPPEQAPAGREVLGRSPIFTPEVINDIHMKSELGRYRMRGFSMFKKLPSWDDLIFLPGTLTRFVIEGYREKCDTRTVLGSRFAKKPLELDIPVYITGMSFGALSLEAKMAL